jgi:hypothetical protein
VGLALIINGVFVSKKQAELAEQTQRTPETFGDRNAEIPALRSADTAEFVPPSFGVTEGTTKHLTTPSPKR